MGISAKRDNGRTVLSEINVTPFVDVMLVLLVIFMITAPILYQGVQVNLPRVTSKPIAATDKKKIIITIDSKGTVFIEKTSIPLSSLGGYINDELELLGRDPAQEQVFLQADSKVEYGRVMGVMAVIKKSGVEKVGLVTEPGDFTPRSDSRKKSRKKPGR